MPKRILGFVFIGLAIILIIAGLGLLPKIIATLAGVYQIFTGKSDGYQVGYVLGSLFWWVIYFVIIALLVKYGQRLSRKTS